MDYSKMIEAHKKNCADATIAVLNVSIEEASRFGIMNTDENLRITEFEEKPKNPKSTNASMGIYVFSKMCIRDRSVSAAKRYRPDCTRRCKLRYIAVVYI